MGFKCGIVGLPNVGKSTLFNALTKAGIEAANFPFCTISPNIGIVPIPDMRLKELATIVKPQKIIPTAMEFVDIAGLVAGASKGEGLGNQFLANIRETDAIAQVVRCFDDDNIVHVANKVSPIEDINTINQELILADLQSCENSLQRQAKKSKSGDEQAKMLQRVLQKACDHLETSQPLRTLLLPDDEKAILFTFNLLTAKPMMYIANVAESGTHNNHYLDQVNQLASQTDSLAVPVCAALESELADLEDEDRDAFLVELNLTEPGLNRIIRAGYQLLNLHTYFTAGVKEVRAWALPVGSTAPQAAGKIHTDFERGFIRAQTISFADFVHYQGELGAKEAGRMRAEGKEYIINDGDIIHFLFNR